MMPPVTYVESNRELVTVTDYFAQHAGQVLSIAWLPAVVEGSRISAGDHLADIVWDTAPGEPLHAPATCTGDIEWLNENIRYETLDLRSQALLRLVAV